MNTANKNSNKSTVLEIMIMIVIFIMHQGSSSESWVRVLNTTAECCC